jgi:hypothetical protein
VKLHHWDGHAVENAVPILAQIQPAQEDLADQVDRPHQVTPPAIKTALRREMRKQAGVVFSATQQFGLHMPATAPAANQGHGDQLTIDALGRGSRSLDQQGQVFPNVIDDDKHPSAKILKAHYRRAVLRWVSLSCGDAILPYRRNLCQFVAFSIRPY